MAAKRKVRNSKAKRKPAPKLQRPKVNYFQCSDRQLLILTGLTALGYFLYTFVFDGYYQHEELSHFLSMVGFWDNPNSVIGNWAKPGYKVLYAIPALAGERVVIILNCLVGAFCCYFVYRIAEKQGLKYPLVAFFCLALQPMWIQVISRSYSEVPTALFYVLTLYFFKDKRYVLAALCLSYAAFIRQETYPIIVVLGIYLLSKKEWLAFLALGIFPFIDNLWGGLVNDDPFYLYNMTIGFAADIKAIYPRQGGQHRFVTSMVVHGAVCVSLFIAYFTLYFNKKFKLDYATLLMFSIYFLEHMTFTIQSLNLGPATGDNLRYMIVICPFIALIAGITLEKYMNLKTVSFKIIAVLAVYLFLILLFMTYHHNNIVLTQERYLLPFVAALAIVLVLLLKMSKQLKLTLIVLLLVADAFIFIRPFRLRDDVEALVIKDMVEYIEQEKPNLENTIWTNHIFVRYQVLSLTDDGNLSKKSEFRKGDLIVWDSHYTKRFTGLEHTYFVDKPDQFKVFYYKQVPRRFAIIIFEKL